jgi:ribosome-associated toxin RatA of RatAB toxin-antitoxin module
MRTVHREAIVPHAAERMYELVNDIEAYPRFLPWCPEAEILEAGEQEIKARLTLSRGGLRRSFTTRNRLEPPTLMTMSLVEGPFSRLEGKWQFTSLGDHSCKVEFELEFTLQSRLLGMAVGKLFEVVASRQVDALCNRARVIYGASPKTH